MIATKEKPIDELSPETIELYRRIMTRLQEARVAFLVGGVAAAVAEGGDVVGQRVEPDVDRLPRIAREGDAPLQAGP